MSLQELKFTAASHKYQSVDNPDKKWVSATSIVKEFKQPFDPKQAEKSSKGKNPKWRGKDPAVIRQIWANEGLRARTLGTWYHDQREDDLNACETIKREGIDLPIIRSLEEAGAKFSPDQALVPGIYPEHFCYLKSASLCGQADRVEIVGNKVNIFDYKTNKEVKTEPFINWQGARKTMLAPLNNLDDCDITHYALQLSIYMYIILKHNHHLEPGKMQINHIVFEVDHLDENGYPVTAVDAAGDPIVKDIVDYDLPYMKAEVDTMINYIKMNPEKFN